MLKKWQSFNTDLLLEKLNGELLLEGKVFFSKEFKKKLSDIYFSSLDSDVSKVISRIYNHITWMPGSSSKYFYFNLPDDKNDKIVQSYVDITSKNDKITSLPIRRISEKNPLEDFDSKYFDLSSRNEVKIGRFIKYICELYNINCTDSTIEKIVNVWKSFFEPEDTQFEIVSGKDIWRYYQEENYLKKEQGTMGNSCMNDETSRVLKVYIDNAKLLVLKTGDKIIGRALLWKLTKSPVESKWFMDRIYTIYDDTVNKFKRYAEEMGYLYKKNQNSHLDENVQFIYKGQEVNGVISVTLQGPCDKYPFIDTLCFLNRTKNKLINVPTKKSYWLHSTYGECSRCENCDGSLVVDSYSKTEIVDGVKVKKREVELCFSCCDGHRKLKEKDVETKWNRYL